MYFSDTTRNFYPAEFVASYRGILLLLLQDHIQFQIVTPRTVGSFKGNVLVLPDVRILSDAESDAIHKFNRTGGKLIVTGQTDKKLRDVSSALRYPRHARERAYLKNAETDFASADPTIAKDLMKSLETPQSIEVHTSRNVAAHVATIGKTALYLPRKLRWIKGRRGRYAAYPSMTR